MSEQEKANAVPTTGTVTEAKAKERWIDRIRKNPKTKKIVKGAIRVGELAMTGLICFALGKKAGANPIPAGNLEAPAEEEENEEEAVEY